VHEALAYLRCPKCHMRVDDTHVERHPTLARLLLQSDRRARLDAAG